MSDSRGGIITPDNYLYQHEVYKEQLFEYLGLCMDSRNIIPPQDFIMFDMWLNWAIPDTIYLEYMETTASLGGHLFMKCMYDLIVGVPL